MTSTYIPREDGRLVAQPSRNTATQRLLLMCGVLSSLVYVAVDLIAAARYPGYSILDQAISELSAIGAPTKEFWSTWAPWYGVFVLAFSIGVHRAAGANRALRITARVLLAFALSGILWWVFPMHTRGVAMTWTDVGHIVLGGASVVFMVLFVGFGAASLGRWFRLYSIASMLAILAAAAVTFAWAPRIAAQQPTPWLGAVERIMIYGYLQWIAVFAVALVRRDRVAARWRAPLA